MSNLIKEIVVNNTRKWGKPASEVIVELFTEYIEYRKQTGSTITFKEWRKSLA